MIDDPSLYRPGESKSVLSIIVLDELALENVNPDTFIKQMPVQQSGEQFHRLLMLICNSQLNARTCM